MPTLEKYQDLPTKGAFAVEQFSINGCLFLAFANYYGNDVSYNTKSPIYKLNDTTGKFTLYQTINRPGVHDIEYFAIADKHYLAVANHYNGGSYVLNSAVYQWNGQQFVVSQDIATVGATSFNFFQTFSDLFLTVTNTLNTNSVIYKWKDNQFKKFQEISTDNPMASTMFAINNETFIAFANYQGSSQGFSVHSSVYKWSVNSFVKLQSLQTSGAYDVKSFKHDGETFLAFANYQNNEYKYNLDSPIYKWNGSKFVLFHTIPTRGASDWYPFHICGQLFLGLANAHADSQGYATSSVVYRFSGSQFIKDIEFSTYGATEFVSFEYKGQIYLAVASFNNGNTFNINSELYKLF